MAVAVLVSRNDALRTHPPAGDARLSVNGSNWLFTVTSIFGLATLIFWALKFRARSGERFFHYLFIITSLTGLIAYYAMASDLAWVPIRQANSVGHSGLVRQIFWAKYVFWVVAFPAIVIALGVLSGVSWATIVYNVALTWTWVIGYLVAAFTPSNFKWGFFAWAFLAHIFALVSLWVRGGSAADRVGIRRDYFALTGWVTFLWLIYPLAWGLTDGGNFNGVTGSFIWFGILDILLFLGTGFAIIFRSGRWDYGRLNIAFTQYGRVPAQPGTFPEKAAPPAAAAGAGAAPAPAPAAAPAAGPATTTAPTAANTATV
ncbi:rhodopsin-like protein [Thermothelomyces thermophilus ATCC 42464]|uniref:Rhodopsin-like protein n=1 Tax=Thermothelomyces thermophilus (strain ATCC 42464 / BCRC 31852 / DSM 1799) TaxID=573729 RepID=G2QN42_THET4|nr:rhodopsin-like protein [Thermothelomyces thermophilus ATCC 42464]AEO61915.1 rhodopsin-like protein [Thermothelomyces thermophilus ATCC 42464]